MGNRKRTISEKVESVKIALQQINLEAAAREAGVPTSTLRYDLKKVEQALPEILANQKPGPKGPPEAVETKPEVLPALEVASTCSECGGKVVKNGTYWVFNWLLMLMLGWQGIKRIAIQRYQCQECLIEIISPERARQAEARKAWWSQVARLVCLSRFKFGLSVRKTQILVEFIYGRPVSIGYINRLTERIGRQAEVALQHLARCSQAKSRFLLYDETYQKMEKRGYSLGVAICEHGLIRSVRCIVKKSQDIPNQLRDVVDGNYQPEYFLTDLDVLFNKYLRDASVELSHLRDKVHIIRHIMRLFDEAVRDVTLDVPKKLPLKQRKKQLKLKRRLLRKQLRPKLWLVLKAFSSGYESICVLILEGVVTQLTDPSVVIQTATVKILARRLQRFVKKHGPAINTLLQLAVLEGTPTTTNGLESKNSIFKPFSRMAKFFPYPNRCQLFFAGVALMENFDIKTRGPNKGTSAIQRANINLDDFGATDFFSAVTLPEPQISLAGITD